MMPSISFQLSQTRERVAPVLLTGARLAFVELLFASPLRADWTWVRHPVAHVFNVYTDSRIYLSDFFLVLTLGLWFLSLLLSPRPLKSGPRFLTLPLAALVALSWLGVWTGIDPSLTAYHSLRVTLLLGLYLYLVNETIPPAWIAAALALGVVSQTAIAVGQFIAQRSLGLVSLGELVLDPGRDGTSIVTLGNLRVLRVYGLTDHPNILGGFLAFGMVLLLGHYLAEPAVGRSRGRYLWLLPLAVGAVGLLLTFSRAAALGFLAGAALLSVALLARASVRARYVRDLAIAGGLVAAFLALPAFAAQPLLAQRVGQNGSFDDNVNEQRSLAERAALLESAERIFFLHPLLGVGNGALPVAMSREDRQFPTQYAYQPAHLVWVDAAAELGIPGGLLWGWLLAAPWVALALRWRTVIASPWLLAAAAALLAVTVIGMFDYYPWLLEPGRLWQWSAWGLFAGAYGAAARTETAPGR